MFVFSYFQQLYLKYSCMYNLFLSKYINPSKLRPPSCLTMWTTLETSAGTFVCYPRFMMACMYSIYVFFFLNILYVFI